MAYTPIKQQYISKHRFAIFGAGRYLKYLLHRYPAALEILQNTVCLIDNNPDKQNRLQYYRGFALPCYSFEEFTERIYADDFIVLVSTYSTFAIIEQIKNYKNDSLNWDCLIALLSDPGSYILDIDTAGKKPVIPKTIHYCWFGGKPIPERWQKCIGSWSKYCPDYEIVRWDETNYDYKKHPVMKNSYDVGVYALASDYARTDILYQYGGIYLDIDVELIKSLDKFRYNDLYYGFEFTNVLNNGIGFGAAKGHELLRENLKFYDCDNIISSSNTFNLVFEMHLITDQMRNYGFRMDNTLQTINGVTLYPSDVFAPRYFNTPDEVIRITDNTHSIHHYAGTHIEPRAKLKL
jgi:hypothetical protein